MQITLGQGILLALMAFICGIDSCLEDMFWFRPLVTAFLSGIILGDIQLGLAAGAVAELSYLGLLTVGGTVPPDPLTAGVMTTVIAYTTGQSAEAALGMSLPFALLAQWGGIICNTTFSGFLQPLDDAASKADTKRYTRIVLTGLLIKSSLFGVIIFLSAYALQGPLTVFVNSFPTFLIHGFEIAGGLMPAVGLALLLVIMLKKQNMAYLFIGFLMSTFLDLGNILPVAVAGIAIAVLDFFNDQNLAKKAAELAEKAGGGKDDGGI